jgi:hypothetical protein
MLGAVEAVVVLAVVPAIVFVTIMSPSFKPETISVEVALEIPVTTTCDLGGVAEGEPCIPVRGVANGAENVCT